MSEFEFRNPFRNAKIVGTNIDGEAYHRQIAKRGDADFVMSRSELMMFASCPSRWIHGYHQKYTDATQFGSLMDCLLTDVTRFKDKYAVQPATVSATKSMKCVQEGKVEDGQPVPWRKCTEADDWKDAHSDKIIISHDENAEAEQACERLMKDPALKSLFLCSDKQVMCIAEYHDPKTKLVVPIKVLIDLVPRKDGQFSGDLADYKTARSAAPRAWVKAIDERHYDCQAALFQDVYNAATGEDRFEFLHVVQENVFPWEFARRIVGLKFIDIGRDKYLSALALYCACLKSGIWPSWETEWAVSEPEDYMVSRMTTGKLFSIPTPKIETEQNDTDLIP